MQTSVLILSALVLFLTRSAVAATIPADALLDFHVDAFAPVGDGPYTTHVVAWRNTGLTLSAGDIFSLQSSGIASESPAQAALGGRTPDGYPGDASDHFIANIPGSRYGLVGKIGEDLGDEFFVGSAFSGVANDTGILFLAFNDTHYFDNSGHFVVSTVASVPEPSLAAFGLAGLIWFVLKGEKRARRSTSGCS